MKQQLKLAAMALLLSMTAGAAAAQEKIKIGVIVTLSGPPAALGAQVRDGFALAVKDLGGKMAGREVEIVSVDDELKPDGAVTKVRGRLRERFDVTLPRFDLMAQLDKVPEGMTLSDVSKRMMVSNGNVTGLVERLVESGHLDRRTSDADRRVQVIRLTKAGRAEFRKMAAEHELWIADIFGDLTPKDVRELMRLLAKTKASAQKSAKARTA